MDEKKIILVSVSDLVPGMIVARDVYTRNNQMLVPADTKITESIITRMTFFGIMSIRVFESELEKNIVDEEEEMYMTQQEKEDFAVFKENYELTIDHLSENLNSLLKTADEIDTDELVENVDKLVFQSKSRYEIMNMVHHIRAFDDETYRHSLNVAMINSVFAGWLGMTEYERKQLTLCGLMHDVGKLLISKDILRKPGRLTEEEYEQIKKHPLLGYEKMKDKNIPESVKRVILLHHERADGSGYPFGFRLNEIDPYAAITAISDVYDAMTSNRVYRHGMSPFDVIEIFEKEGRKQFNPMFLVPILNNLTNTYLQHYVELSNGMKGKIVLINKNELSRPMIATDDNQFIDLLKQRDIKITQVR
ncbi:MAG: HD-GYP domain-containing protein [Roseburia sp.]|nr:HD-GYP domain-containing protein [Roseburia sp.]